MSRKNKKVNKKLDIPAKRVYNIYKDGRELLALSTALNPGGWQPSKVDNEIERLKLASSYIEKFFNGLQLPQPVIAGGAVRDLLMGKTPKDYDVFLNFDTEEELDEGLDRLCLGFHDNDVKVTEGGAGDEYELNAADFEDVHAVFNAPNRVQYIVGVWPKADDPTERFDLSTTRCWFDFATKSVHYTDHFVDSIIDRQVKRYRNSDYSRNRQKNQQEQVFATKTNYYAKQYGINDDLAYKHIDWKVVAKRELKEQQAKQILRQNRQAQDAELQVAANEQDFDAMRRQQQLNDAMRRWLDAF